MYDLFSCAYVYITTLKTLFKIYTTKHTHSFCPALYAQYSPRVNPNRKRRLAAQKLGQMIQKHCDVTSVLYAHTAGGDTPFHQHEQLVKVRLGEIQDSVVWALVVKVVASRAHKRGLQEKNVGLVSFRTDLGTTC